MIEPSAHPQDPIEAVADGLVSMGYIPSRKIATAVYLAEQLSKPILVEGPAGVGKTELSKAVAGYRGLPLIRMQCYEGLDEAKALYEWKYGKQLLYTQILKDRLGEEMRGAASLDEALARLDAVDDIFFSERFLEERPLLRALRHPAGAVLLIDEVDKADQEFEAFLLEILSDFQVTIPELGTVSATIPPLVFLTSNSTRMMGDALKRRCLHLHIGYPEPNLERRIVEVRVPGVGERLRRQLVAFVQQIRGLDLKKQPSVSETIDWARVLLLLHADSLENEMVRDTLNVLLKFEEDVEAVDLQAPVFIRQALQESGA
jgi:MoxR-like ATPase